MLFPNEQQEILEPNPSLFTQKFSDFDLADIINQNFISKETQNISDIAKELIRFQLKFKDSQQAKKPQSMEGEIISRIVKDYIAIIGVGDHLGYSPVDQNFYLIFKIDDINTGESVRKVDRGEPENKPYIKEGETYIFYTKGLKRVSMSPRQIFNYFTRLKDIEGEEEFNRFVNSFGSTNKGYSTALEASNIRMIDLKSKKEVILSTKDPISIYPRNRSDADEFLKEKYIPKIKEMVKKLLD